MDVPKKVERRINRRIATAQFGKIRRQLDYKSEWAGVEIVEVEEDVPVSERCSQCGYRNENLGGGEKLRCEGCGRTVNRETNAMENYLLEERRTKEEKA
jgi:putative transposase